MSYKEWFEEHGNKHAVIIKKLEERGLDKDEIIDYFDFDNMVVNEPDFCYLYPDKKKCHDMESLNCYLCACPLFRFNSNGIRVEGDKTLYSICDVNAKGGTSGVFGDAIHQDCSNCIVPHSRKYVSLKYDCDWFSIMQDCELES